mmetsp:Transcript_51444/g.151682  ORF Transcript_51444/g.151682 Transcript_51444/m.151682 type:complete len:167 (+) Transcript_51444:78-578(+)
MASPPSRLPFPSRGAFRHTHDPSRLAGVCKLLSSLATKLATTDFHWLLEVAEGILHAPTALRAPAPENPERRVPRATQANAALNRPRLASRFAGPAHSQQLLKAFEPATQKQRAGELRLGDRDARRLARVMSLLRVTSTAVLKAQLVGGNVPAPPLPIPAAPLAWS